MTKETAVNKEERLREELNGFTGTTEYYQHTNRHIVYTEGVKHFAEQAGAYWLIDAIASYFFVPKMRDAMEKDERIERLQFWRLELIHDIGGYAMLTARADSDCEPFIVQYISDTDFPLDSIDIWAVLGCDGNHWVLYLPSEH